MHVDACNTGKERHKVLTTRFRHAPQPPKRDIPTFEHVNNFNQIVPCSSECAEQIADNLTGGLSLATVPHIFQLIADSFLCLI
jgi:hypothetical protein